MSEQRLFISHASDDEAVVNRIVAYLEAHGVPCWVSSRDIPPRAIYADAITEGMQSCSACAVIVSTNANQSKGVKRELELASHYDKPFIPIRIDATEPAAGVDYYLRNTQWMDFKRDGDRALDRIVAHMAGAPGGDAPPPRHETSALRSAPPAHSPGRPPMPVVIALAAFAVLIGVGGWVWTNATHGENSEQVISGTNPLLGSYRWDGVACGAGPTVTEENNALVFTMPGAPTYRHQARTLDADAPSDGWRVETRVLAPSDHAGETYAFEGRDNSSTINVMNAGRTNVWERCRPTESDSLEQASTLSTEPAPRPRSQRATTQNTQQANVEVPACRSVSVQETFIENRITGYSRDEDYGCGFPGGYAEMCEDAFGSGATGRYETGATDPHSACGLSCEVRSTRTVQRQVCN